MVLNLKYSEMNSINVPSIPISAGKASAKELQSLGSV